MNIFLLLVFGISMMTAGFHGDIGNLETGGMVLFLMGFSKWVGE